MHNLFGRHRNYRIFLILSILFIIALFAFKLTQRNDEIFISTIQNNDTKSIFTRDFFGKQLYFSPPGFCFSASCIKGAMISKLDLQTDLKNYVDDSNYWNVGIISKDERTLIIESYSNARIKWLSEADNKFDDSLFKIISVEKFTVSRTPNLEIVNVTLESGEYYE